MRPRIAFRCSVFAIVNFSKAGRARPSILTARGSLPTKARNSRGASRVPVLLFNSCNPLSYSPLTASAEGTAWAAALALGDAA